MSFEGTVCCSGEGTVCCSRGPFIVQGRGLFIKGEAIHCLRDPGRRLFIIQGRGLFASFKGGDSLSFIKRGGHLWEISLMPDKGY